MTGSPWTQPFKWTHEQIEKLQTLWNKELTGLEIAEILGITRNAVLGKLYRLGRIPTGRGTSPMRSEAVRVRAAKVKVVAEKKTKEIASRQQGAVVKQRREGREPLTSAPHCPVPPPPIPEPRTSHWTGMAAEIDVTEPWECHWPLGAAYKPSTAFCKAPAIGGSSYCEYHHAMSISPAQAKQWYESGRHQ